MKIFGIENGWPCGVSDGLILNCSICGNHTNFDYTINDNIWEKIVPAEIKQDVVCLDCLDKLLKNNGLLLSHCLEKVQYTAKGETIILVPDISFVYNKKENGDHT